MSIAVRFSEPGTLGLKLSPNKRTGSVELLSLNAGTQADRHPDLRPGLIVRSVAGASVAGKSYADVLAMIKRAGRPLDVAFDEGGTLFNRPASAKVASLVLASFAEPGTLGLKLVENRRGLAEVQALNPGTQAERHAELHPGMIVRRVGGASVEGQGYAEVLRRIKAGGRPLEIGFSSQRQAREEIPAEMQTGQAAAAALQRHIKEKGTTDVKTIDRLRRASLQPDSSGPTQASAEALMAAAMAAVDEEEEQGAEEQQGEGGDVEATFTEAANLGIKFGPNERGEVEVLSIHAGGQAERHHKQLKPGLVLTAVGDESVRGVEYKAALQKIRGGGRPLTLRLRQATAAPVAAEEPAQSIVSEDETGIIVEVSERSYLVDTASGIVFDRLALEHMAESDEMPEVGVWDPALRKILFEGGAAPAADAPPAAADEVVPRRLEFEGEITASVLEAKLEEARQEGAVALAAAEEQHQAQLASLETALAREQQLKLMVEQERDAEKDLVSELNAVVECLSEDDASASASTAQAEANRQLTADLAAARLELEAEQERSAALATDLSAEKARAEGSRRESESLQARLELAEAEAAAAAAEAAEAARAVSSSSSSAAEELQQGFERKLAQSAAESSGLRSELAASQQALEQQQRQSKLQLEAREAALGDELESLRGELLRQGREHEALSESTAAEVALYKSQLQAEVERNRSAEQAAETTAAAAKPGDGAPSDGGPFMCVSCAAQKSVAARDELDQRQGALLREREELLATMEKARAAEQLEAAQAQLSEARSEIERLQAEAQRREQKLLDAQAELARATQDSADANAAAISGAIASSAAQNALKFSAAEEAAAEGHAQSMAAVQSELDAARSEAMRLRGEMHSARSASSGLAATHEETVRNAVATAEAKHALELTSQRNSLEATWHQERAAITSELEDYRSQLQAAREELEAETRNRLALQTAAEQSQQLEVANRDKLTHEASMAIELSQAATAAVADAQHTAEALVDHHAVELSALRTTSAAEVTEISRVHQQEKQSLRSEMAAMQSNAESELQNTVLRNARELQEMVARSDAAELQASEEAASQLEEAKLTHSRALSSAKSAAEASEASLRAEAEAAVEAQKRDTEAARTEVGRLRSELQDVRAGNAQELAELSAAHAAAVLSAVAAEQAKHTVELSSQRNAMEGTVQQTRAKMTSELEDVQARGAVEVESVRSSLELEMRTKSGEYERSLAAMAEQLDATMGELEAEKKQRLELQSAEQQAEQMKAAQLEVATALAEAHNTADALAKSHALEVATLRTTSAAEIDNITKVHAVEKESLRSTLASHKISAEAELHDAIQMHARELEDMQARGAAAEVKITEDSAARLQQVKAGAQAAADASAEAHEALRADAEAAWAQVAQFRAELQDVKAQHAVELEELAEVHAAAAADVAAAAAAAHAMDMAEREEEMEAGVQKAHDDASEEIEAARQRGCAPASPNLRTGTADFCSAISLRECQLVESATRCEMTCGSVAFEFSSLSSSVCLAAFTRWRRYGLS